MAAGNKENIKENIIEERLERIVNLHTKINDMLNDLPVNLPISVLNVVKERILNDKELLNLMNDIKERRAPRFMTVGSTGAGKSSLINAINSRYLSETSSVFACTVDAVRIDYTVNNKVVFQIIDTRGIGESGRNTGQDLEAEKQLEYAIKEFQPDAVLFVLPADVRAHIDDDVEVLKKICQAAGQQIPLITVVTKADKLEPQTQLDPSKYSRRKKENIENKVAQVRGILKKKDVECIDVIPVSSLIEWDKSPEEIPKSEWPNLKMEVDYRYNIEKLVELLESNIDIKAAIQLTLNYKVEVAAKKIAERISKIFSLIASGVGAAAVIPIGDLPILCAMQVILVLIIAYLSGKDSGKAALLEFIAGLGIIGGAGFILRTFVQQAGKLLNIIPGAGAAISGATAGMGTYCIGKAASAYFFDGAEKDKLGSVVKEAEKEYENQKHGQKKRIAEN